MSTLLCSLLGKVINCVILLPRLSTEKRKRERERNRGENYTLNNRPIETYISVRIPKQFQTGSSASLHSDRSDESLNAIKMLKMASGQSHATIPLTETLCQRARMYLSASSDTIYKRTLSSGSSDLRARVQSSGRKFFLTR